MPLAFSLCSNLVALSDVTGSLTFPYVMVIGCAARLQEARAPSVTCSRFGRALARAPPKIRRIVPGRPNAVGYSI
jgi:hypothetical protein